MLPSTLHGRIYITVKSVWDAQISNEMEKYSFMHQSKASYTLRTVQVARACVLLSSPFFWFLDYSG